MERVNPTCCEGIKLGSFPVNHNLAFSIFCSTGKDVPLAENFIEAILTDLPEPTVSTTTLITF